MKFGSGWGGSVGWMATCRCLSQMGEREVERGRRDDGTGTCGC